MTDGIGEISAAILNWRMKKIEGELISHYQRDVPYVEGNFLNKDFKISKLKQWDRFGATVNKVRASEGYVIKNFRDLIEQVAQVTLNNQNYEMFYRGQSQDYLNNQSEFYKDRKPKSVVLPNICRPERKEDGMYKYSIRKKVVQDRYKNLYDFIDFANRKNKRQIADEIYMALIQHYEIIPTPLIDITQSLRVAATFALRQNKRGFVYVFGLPYPNQSISYFRDFGIILLKLQNVISTDALRPRYQEGYLVGKFPFSDIKESDDDLSNRMIAKFIVDDTNNDFWDEHFLPMPEEVLFPQVDAFESKLKQLFEDFVEGKAAER